MKCKQCGKELTNSAKFCTNCGTEVIPDEVSYTLNGYEIENNETDNLPSLSCDKKETSGIDNIKEKWNDKYTILVIIGIMAIAVVSGFIVKNIRTQNEDFAYEEYTYNEPYDSDEIYDEENENAEETNQENVYYEEELSDKEKDTESESQNFQDFILSDSSARFLSLSDLDGLSAMECRLARNEIYARHGRMFKDEVLQEYFESFDWYYPSIQPDDFEESMLNEYEISNLDLIVEYETEQGFR